MNRDFEPINGPEDETLDDLLKGRLKIYQKKSGFRYSIDALLLADFAGRAIGGLEPKTVHAADLGSGTGVISMALTAWEAIKSVTGIEMAEPMVEMSRRSVLLNGLADRVTILTGDIRNPPAVLKPESLDLVVCNPPYRPVGQGRLNPDNQKAMARHELTVELADILKITKRLLKPRGMACFIYGAFRLTDIITGLRKEKLEPAEVRCVHSREGDAAKLALVRAVKGGKNHLEILPPLIIYRDEENYTEEVLRIFEGPQ